MKIQKENKYKGLSNAFIFTQIYYNNIWGGKKGEYFSGIGSHNNFISGYVKVVADFIIANNVRSIVEIGCGDFHVAGLILKQLENTSYSYNYSGYDVVKALIDRNNKLYGSHKIKFYSQDASIYKIVTGDLLIIRQVLQHLNNKSIMKIVRKFQNYKFIIVTEHQPSEQYGDLIIPNLDKPSNQYIRAARTSAVYLDSPPFNCNIKSLLYSIEQRIHNLEASINTHLISNVDNVKL